MITVIADKGKYDVNLGNTIVLKCRWVERPIETSVYWHKNCDESELVPQDQHDPRIVIRNSKLEDAGAYACHAYYNLNGCRSEFSVNIRLNVHGKLN